LCVETAAHQGGSIEVRDTNPFAVRNFRSYVDRIRQFSVYLNTTLRSPMPRSRGEAMMTGVIPVCLRNHDVDRFVENGVDGFYADTPEDLAAFLNDLFRDRGRILEMSRAARRKAMDVFNHDRYLAAWTNLLGEIA
jgi:glycosyltransferase involved in cell wall biosynthesis